MNITDDFRNKLYEILDDLSVGDVPFGVLKTFYEDDVLVLYNELIDTMSNECIIACEHALKITDVRMFLYYLYTYRNTVNSVYKKTENIDCIVAACLLDNHLRVSVINLLQKKSLIRIKIETAFEGILQKQIDYENFYKDLEELSNRYGLKVTTFNVPPMRHMNKYELDDLKKSQVMD